MTDEQRAEAFPAWVSGYYFNHAPILRTAFEAKTLDEFPSITDFHKGIQRNMDETIRPPTLRQIPPDTLERISSMNVFRRSTLPILFFDKSFYAECAQRMVFDEEFAKRHFPRVPVHIVNCMQSHGDCMTCTYTLKEMVLKRDTNGQGQGGRKIDFVAFDGVNHMAHWDDPEKTMKFLASIV